MIDKQYLLSSKQMAEFVARGFLRFDELAPDEINREVMRGIDRQEIKGHRSGTPLSQCYHGHIHPQAAGPAANPGLDPQSRRRRSAFRS